MGTFVTIEVLGSADESDADREIGMERAFDWFREIERTCTRFDPSSELMQLSRQHGRAVPVSPLLFEAVHFATMVARETGGAFDPTVGRRMEHLGFNREHRSGREVHSAFVADDAASYRDVHLDTAAKTIALDRPLVLDLGAVAKGLAIDMAARELAPHRHFAIDAGGDLYLGGRNADDAPWSVGIRHPREDHGLIASLRVSDCAVCTSGDYERRSPLGDGSHHIVGPGAGHGANAVASATVVAHSAMLADALGTAAFVLGPAAGIALLERHGVEGLIVSAAMEQRTTQGFSRDVHHSPHA